jgi:hypothetical protein
VNKKRHETRKKGIMELRKPLPIKEAHAMSSITQNLENENLVHDKIEYFFKTYRLGEILRSSNAYKEKGIPVMMILKYLFTLVFRNCSMYNSMRSGRYNEYVHSVFIR